MGGGLHVHLPACVCSSIRIHATPFPSRHMQAPAWTMQNAHACKPMSCKPMPSRLAAATHISQGDGVPNQILLALQCVLEVLQSGLQRRLVLEVRSGPQAVGLPIEPLSDGQR